MSYDELLGEFYEMKTKYISTIEENIKLRKLLGEGVPAIARGAPARRLISLICFLIDNKNPARYVDVQGCQITSR